MPSSCRPCQYAPDAGLRTQALHVKLAPAQQACRTQQARLHHLPGLIQLQLDRELARIAAALSLGHDLVDDG